MQDGDVAKDGGDRGMKKCVGMIEGKVKRGEGSLW